MLNAIIIEDERPALEVLEKALMSLSTEVKVIAKLRSVKEGIEYIANKPEADIIFSEVQLRDGLSFDIFNHAPINIPIIFITGHSDYMMTVFEHNGIDYLLKPVEKSDLEKAISKYNNLQQYFNHKQDLAPAQNLLKFNSQRKKTRLLVKKGIENIALRFDEIALIYAHNKMVYVMDGAAKKYVCDKTLSELQEELDHSLFFRVNRQYIINIDFVKSFKPFEKVKLLIDITVPDINHSIIISQETAPAFRKWMHDA